MANGQGERRPFYQDAETERDYGGGAGYARRAAPRAGDESARDADDLEWRRAWRERLPIGRVLDLEDLRQLIDEGNQTNRAILLRKRLLEYARKQLYNALVVTEREWGVMKLWNDDKQPDGTPYPRYGAPKPWKPEIPEWP